VATETLYQGPRIKLRAGIQSNWKKTATVVQSALKRSSLGDGVLLFVKVEGDPLAARPSVRKSNERVRRVADYWKIECPRNDIKRLPCF